MDEALNYTEKACKLEPENRESATNKAIILFRMQKYDLSRDVAKTQHDRHPDYPIAEAIYNAATHMVTEMAAGGPRTAQDQL